MFRSMYSAISGLKNHQVSMDVIGNNIANAATTAFKSSRVAFQDIVSQTMRAARAPETSVSGSNPIQVGLGISLAAVEASQSQGSLQATGRSTDFAIQGNGYFILSDGTSAFYTRDGSFNLSADGFLISSFTGRKVQGWLVSAGSATDPSVPPAGTIDTTVAPRNITIPIGKHTAGKATSAATLKGNLNAAAAIGTASRSMATLDVYDSLGTRHALKVTFEKTGSNTWTWLVTPVDSADTVSTGATSFTFGSDGVYSTSNPVASLSITFTNGATTPATAALDLSTLTQFATSSEVNVSNQDGIPAAALVDFAVGSDGQVVGNFANGATQKLGQIALATFANPRGLYSVGNNQYQISGNSGAPVIGIPASGARGSVVGGALESSNVDLAQEFTDLIVAERGFQANARVITSADQMLQDLVNLKR